MTHQPRLRSYDPTDPVDRWGQHHPDPEQFRSELEELRQDQASKYEDILVLVRHLATPAFEFHHRPFLIQASFGPIFGAWEVEPQTRPPTHGLRKTPSFRESIADEGRAFQDILEDFATRAVSERGIAATLDFVESREEGARSKFVVRLDVPDDTDDVVEIWDALSEELTRRFREEDLMDERGKVYLDLWGTP